MEFNESLDRATHCERSWYVEAERRLREIERGQAVPIPAGTVFREARILLDAMRQ